MRSSAVDAVFGSRFIGAAPNRSAYRMFSLGNRLATLLSNLLSGLDLSDMTSCYKMFRREFIQDLILEENGFGFDAEIIAKISRKNCRIGEVPVSYRGRTYAEGKKFGAKDGCRVFYAIFKYNLRYLFTVAGRKP